MASSLSITKDLGSDALWEITAFVMDGGTLPQDIFMYENTGTNVLGRYIGVTSLVEYNRLVTFTGTPIPKFGNRFVKTTQAKIKLDAEGDPDLVIQRIVNAVKNLNLSIQGATNSTQIISIP